MAKKVLTLPVYDVDNNQTQPDQPTLSATDFKVLLDKSVTDNKTFQTDTQIPELTTETVDASGAHGIGFGSTQGDITSDNVGDALDEIVTIAKDAQAGTIMDNSIARIKLDVALKSSTGVQIGVVTVSDIALTLGTLEFGQIFNFTVDTAVLAPTINSVPTKGLDGSAIDLELNTLYSGYLVDDTVDFFQLAPRGSGGNVTWLQQFTGANEQLVDEKDNNVEIKVGDYVYNLSGKTIMDVYEIPAVTDATWEEELKPFKELPNGNDDTIATKNVSGVLDITDAMFTAFDDITYATDLTTIDITGSIPTNAPWASAVVGQVKLSLVGADEQVNSSAFFNNIALAGDYSTTTGDRIFITSLAGTFADLAAAKAFYMDANLKMTYELLTPVVIADTNLKMSSPFDGETFLGYKSKVNEFLPSMKADAEPVPYNIGSQQANLLISHSGQGTLKSIMMDNAVTSITIDGVHFQQINAGLTSSNILLGIPFKTSYEIYSSVISSDLIAVSEDTERVPLIKTANIAASSVQSSIVSDTGYGIIKSFDSGKNPTLIVDGVTVYDKQKAGILAADIYYFVSFDFQADVSTEVFNYNRLD